MLYTEYRDLVRKRGGFTVEEDAERAIQAVLEVLGQKISAGQAEELNAFPRRLFIRLKNRDSQKLAPGSFARRLKLSDIKGRSLMIHAGGDNYSDAPAPLREEGEEWRAV